MSAAVSKVLAPAAAAQVAPQPRTKERLLVTYSGPDGAEAALDELARAGLPREADVLFAVPRVMIPRWSNRRRPRLFPHGWYVRTVAVSGAGLIAHEVPRIAEEWDADLVLVGSGSGRQPAPDYFACSAPGVAAGAHCSVRIARPSGRGSAAAPRLVVGVDGSPGAGEAVREIARRAWPRGAAARLVAVRERGAEFALERRAGRAPDAAADGDGRARVSSLALHEAAGALRAAGLEVSQEVRCGDPAEELAAAAREWEADCVVVGSHGAGRASGGDAPRPGLGAVAGSLARLSPVSVEIVRAPRRT